MSAVHSKKNLAAKPGGDGIAELRASIQKAACLATFRVPLPNQKKRNQWRHGPFCSCSFDGMGGIQT
jgi:hypothetical protein